MIDAMSSFGVKNALQRDIVTQDIFFEYCEILEAVVQRCSVKKVFLEISQNSQENTCARASFLIKLQASGLQLY